MAKRKAKRKVRVTAIRTRDGERDTVFHDDGPFSTFYANHARVVTSSLGDVCVTLGTMVATDSLHVWAVRTGRVYMTAQCARALAHRILDIVDGEPHVPSPVSRNRVRHD